MQLASFYEQVFVERIDFCRLYSKHDLFFTVINANACCGSIFLQVVMHAPFNHVVVIAGCIKLHI